jgi:hypothetical protein
MPLHHSYKTHPESCDLMENWSSYIQFNFTQFWTGCLTLVQKTQIDSYLNQEWLEWLHIFWCSILWPNKYKTCHMIILGATCWKIYVRHFKLLLNQKIDIMRW